MKFYSIATCNSHSRIDIPLINLNFRENCRGQNRNMSMLMYLEWCVIMGFEDTIKFRFLVVGNTKSICDRIFGHVKRRMRIENVNCPQKFIEVV